MATKKRGLSTDLDTLFRKVSPKPVNMESTPSEAREDSGLVELSVDKLHPGRYQPRKHIGEAELEPLVSSIKSQGIIQPLVVRMLARDNYEIVAGERRWRASIKAGLDTVPVIVREISDESACAIALIENLQREELNAIEEALAFERLIKEFSLSHEKLAGLIGKSRSVISNSLRLLNLRQDVQTFLERGDLEVGHAKVLLAISGALQSKLAREIVARDLSVRDSENLVARASADSGLKAVKPKLANDKDVENLERKIADKLGALVKIQQTNKGAGRLTIKYNSLDELDGIVQHLGLVD